MRLQTIFSFQNQVLLRNYGKGAKARSEGQCNLDEGSFSLAFDWILYSVHAHSLFLSFLLLRIWPTREQRVNRIKSKESNLGRHVGKNHADDNVGIVVEAPRVDKAIAGVDAAHRRFRITSPADKKIPTLRAGSDQFVRETLEA